MRKLLKPIEKYLAIVLILFPILLSCGSTESKENQFEIPKLMEREKNLSYDEFIKIKQKYNQLVQEFKSDSTNFECLIKLSEIYIFEARVTGEHPYYYNAALTTLEELIKNKKALTPDQNFLSLFYKSTVQLSQHRFKEALITGEQALKLNSVNAGIYGVLVDANVELGNYSTAVKYCDKMMQMRPDLRSYSRTSYLREIYGDIEGSKESMNLAIESGAPYSEYKCWTIVTMGKMLEEHNQLDSAGAYYEFALQERPNYPFAIAGMASLEAKKGNFKKADSLYSVALKIIPEIGFTIEQAKLYQLSNNNEKFNKKVTEIEKLFKEDLESGHNVSLEYAVFLAEMKNDLKGALKLGLEEFEIRPKNIDVNKLLAYVYYAKGDSGKAAKHAAIALKTNKKDADLMCISGLALNDNALIIKSFEVNPFQDHKFVSKAKARLS